MVVFGLPVLPGWADLPAWTPHPLLRKEVKGRGELRVAPFSPPSGELSFYSPDPETPPFTTTRVGEEATLRVESGKGNYHWIALHRNEPERELSLATVHFFSLVGPSPQAMLAVPKSRLEIVPSPLPREHSVYRAEEAWDFLLRFDGLPLAGQVATLYAPGQMAKGFRSDERGVVHVVFPEFSKPSGEQKTGHSRRPLQPFQLGVEHVMAGRHFTSVFQYEYGPAPLFHRSPWMGWLVTGVGMGGGLLLWRRGRGAKR
ncbi:MAG: hypothetical protein HQM03_01155 [Magnetococcales bacterium]|nr:hypothetical protein [Magnetococcales bacterium]